MSRSFALILVRSRAVWGVTIALSLLASSVLLMGKGPARPALRPKPAPLPTTASLKARPRLVESYGHLPLGFEINQGQTDPQVKFLSRGSGYTLFLTGNEAALALRTPRPPVGAGMRGRRPTPPSPWSMILPGFERQLPGMPARDRNPEPAIADIVRMRLVGANLATKVTGLDQLPGNSNYFIGNDPKKWRTNVPTYAKVKYEDVYPGVDLVYYGNQGQLEYDFVVRPGADPKAITLAIDATNLDDDPPHHLKIDPGGNLVIPTPRGDLILRKPLVYQPATGILRKDYIDAGYVVANGRYLAFELAKYDRHRPLVLDPLLVYSTYLGGGGTASAIAVDAAGNAYIAGVTSSLPTTPGAYLRLGNGNQKFVCKLNATGTAFMYSTYLDQGDGAFPGPTSIALDAAANAYITGRTISRNYPTTLGAC